MTPNALIIGSSGFLGSYLKESLKDRFRIFSIDMIDEKHEDHFVCNIATCCPKLKDLPYDLVVHNAGLAHRIPKNKEEADLFFSVNTEGFKNILDSINQLTHKPKCVILISTVAVYGREIGENIDESHPRESKSPYGQSKILAEDALLKFAKVSNVDYYILRLPLLIGKHAKGNLQKITAAISKGRYFNIKNNTARKSAVLASDVASLIKQLPDINKAGTYNLTDSHHPSFNQLANVIAKKIKNKSPRTLPYFFVQFLSFIGDILGLVGISFPLNKTTLEKMYSSLTFSDQKAQEQLQWKPNSVLTFYK